MPQRPLLFFPSRESATRSKLPQGNGSYSKPTASRQHERLNSRFQSLRDALESQRLILQQSAVGVEPEQVLVFEIIGRVDDFVNAVNKIEGFEWLGEIDIEDIVPDEDFFEIRNGIRRESTLNGRLYLIMSNCTAMNQLLSLWQIYTHNESVRFERGKSKFKNIFKLLKNVRKWDVQDRFEESNVLRIWEENLQIDPNRVIRFEIELWYRKNQDLRQSSYNSIRALVENINGRIITSCDIPEITYHSILAELPAIEIRNMLENNNTELVKCENIMFFRPSGQIVTSIEDTSIYEQISSDADISTPMGEPVVAIFDGYPLVYHNKLAGRLIIDDPDTFEQYYQVEDRKHGTAMCSLIVRGDLNDNEAPLSTPLYVRPIMRPNELDRYRAEFVPNDILLVDTIHRAVKRMFEGEDGNPPVAPSVQIINLSICDPDRPFYHTMSPCAKLLDWLSWRYKVLFIISVGNHSKNLDIGLTKIEFGALTQIAKEKCILQTISNDSRNRRILSPSEAINSISVGSLQSDNATIDKFESRIDPYKSLLPSTYTAFGFGYRKAIKPDLTYQGGRELFDEPILNSNTQLTPRNYNRPPGLSVALPDSSLNAARHLIGTSNSAALVSRMGHFCHEILKDLFIENGIYTQNTALLIKAMLAHGCSWNNIGDNIEARIDLDDWRKVKNLKHKLIGYGLPNISKVQECTAQRVTVIGFGELMEEEAHVYSLPLPPSLASQTIKRRLTITLAWFAPVASDTQKYRIPRMWFESNNQLADTRLYYDEKAVRRGTLQHEIFEDNSATAFIDGDVIKIKVNCTKDAKNFEGSIAYGLIVSLEVAEGLDLPIYQEVRDRIIVPVQVDQRV